MTSRSNQCAGCKDGTEPPFAFSMAFQPIVDVARGTIFAYEALARGAAGEPAQTVLRQVTDLNRYAFDQCCRVTAIRLAARLGLLETDALLSINFMPGAVYSPAACLQLTLKTAQAVGVPAARLLFEVTEAEEVSDREHMRGIFEEYRNSGLKTALDDFGAGYSGLNLLADLPADLVKLDMDLIRNLHQRPRARAIVSHLVRLANDMGFQPIAEGVETVEEYRAILDCGITLMQGYLLGSPAFEALPGFTLPGTDGGRQAT